MSIMLYVKYTPKKTNNQTKKKKASGQLYEVAIIISIL